MPTRRVTVNQIPGLRSSVRALAVLESEGDDAVNAFPILRRFEAVTHSKVLKEREAVWAVFRDWMTFGRERQHEKLHHGWPPDSEFSIGYVFKWDNYQRRHRRLYGFLTTPRPKFDVCVLCCYRSKDTGHTEPEVKRIVRALSEHPTVKEAVKLTFGQGGEKQWVH